MIRCSYSTYLFTGKKQQFSSRFYIFFITAVFILTSCCSINIFAGTTGIDDYDSDQFKKFIMQEFMGKKTSTRYIEETENDSLTHEKFQTLINELVRCKSLNKEEEKKLNSLITSARKEKEKARKGKKKRKEAALTQSQKMEDILRSLMEQGVKNGKLPDIISTMLRVYPVNSVAITIQAAYADWFRKAEAQRTTMAMPSGASEAQETVDGEETPSSENTITPKTMIHVLQKALGKTDRQRATQVPCGQTCLFRQAKVRSTPSIEVLVAPTASLFFENLLDDTSKIDWPSIALAWLSIKKEDSEIFKLFLHNSHHDRFEYFQSLITREAIQTQVFMKLAAIFHETGDKEKDQAKKMMEPVTEYHLDLNMKGLLEHINEEYPTSAVFYDFYNTGLVNFFEKNKDRFKNTAISHINALRKKMKLTTPNIEPVLSDLIDAVRQNKSPDEKIESYYELLILISNMQEKQETDNGLIFLNIARMLLDQLNSQTDPAHSGAYDEPDLSVHCDESAIKRDIIDILDNHGTREQKIGMILMTNGRIYSDPANLPSQAKNHHSVSIRETPTKAWRPPHQEATIIAMKSSLDFDDKGLSTIAGNPTINAEWKSIALAIFAAEEPKRALENIKEEIKEIIRLNQQPDDRPYYRLHHALSVARDRINDEYGVGIKSYPHKFDDKLYNVLRQKGFLNIAGGNWTPVVIPASKISTFW